MTHIIRIGQRYYSARRGHCGGLVPRSQATRFTHSEATDKASRIAGAEAETLVRLGRRFHEEIVIAASQGEPT